MQCSTSLNKFFLDLSSPRLLLSVRMGKARFPAGPPPAPLTMVRKMYSTRLQPLVKSTSSYMRLLRMGETPAPELWSWICRMACLGKETTGSPISVEASPGVSAS